MPEGWERTYREIRVLHTVYPSHEKRLAAEARDAAHQTESDAAQAAYEAEIAEQAAKEERKLEVIKASYPVFPSMLAYA
jgi:hypothetical protein